MFNRISQSHNADFSKLSFSFLFIKNIPVMGLTCKAAYCTCIPGIHSLGQKHLPYPLWWPELSYPVKLNLHLIEMQESSVWIIDLISQRIHFTKRMTHSKMTHKTLSIEFWPCVRKFLIFNLECTLACAGWVSVCTCVMHVFGIHFTLHQLNYMFLS